MIFLKIVLRIYWQIALKGKFGPALLKNLDQSYDESHPTTFLKNVT